MFQIVFYYFVASNPFLSYTGTVARISGDGSLTQAILRQGPYLSFTEIIIENGVTEIQDYTFVNCYALQTLTIPKSIVTINVNSGHNFRYLRSMVNFIVDSEISSFCNDDQGALYNKSMTLLIRVPCTKTEFTIPNTVIEISPQCFQAAKLVSLIFPPNVEKLNTGIVYDWRITSQTITFLPGSKITEFPLLSFAHCSIMAVTVPKSVVKIRSQAFYYTSLQTISFEKDSMLQSIDTSCFSTCFIEAVEFPEGFLTLAYAAFDTCPYLTTIVIPSTTNSISSTAFSGCPKLASITVSPSNQYYHMKDGILLSKDNKVLLTATVGVSSITIPAETTSVGPTAIQGCVKVSKVNIAPGNTVFQADGGVLYKDNYQTCVAVAGGTEAINFHANLVTISEFAAYSCALVKTINFLGSNLSTIQKRAFEDCVGLTDVDLSTAVNLNQYSFSGTTNLNKVTFSGAKITKLERYVFENSGLKTIIFSKSISELEKYTLCRATKLVTCTFDPDSLITRFDVETFRQCYALTSILIPSNVEEIAGTCFMYCYKLESIDFFNANKLQAIRNQAFTECTSLKTLSLPSSLITLANNAFEKCTSLTTINFPITVEKLSISSSCFYGCTALTSVMVPDTKNLVDATVFEGCTNLKSITCVSGSQKYKSQNGILYSESWVLLACPCGLEIASLSEDLSGVDANAFFRIALLSEVKFPANCPLSTLSDNTFLECNKLKRITFSSSIASMSSKTIVSCHSIEYISFPQESKLKSLPSTIFKGYDALKTVEFGVNSVISSIGSESFSGCVSLTRATFSGTVKSIGIKAFKGCSKLEHIEFIETTQITQHHEMTIEEDAFMDCEKLTMFDFDIVATIKDGAFMGSGLANVKIS